MGHPEYGGGARRGASPNERAILDYLRRHPGVGRAELARVTGLANQSISRIVAELVERGLCAFGEAEASGARGPAALPLALRADAAFTLGVSLMTDRIELRLANLCGAAVCEAALTPTDMSRATVLPQLAAWLRRACEDHRLSRRRVVGAGLSVTGYFIGEGARVNPPPGLDDWALKDLDAVLEAALDLPVWVDNDGNAAAVGEQMAGVGAWAEDFAYLYFAAGFGGGVISRGGAFRGAHGNAGEFASILPGGYVSPTLERLRVLLTEGGRACPTLSDMLADFDARAPGVDRWLEEAARALGLVVSAISATLDPQAIVLGGRLPRSLAERLIPMIAFVNPPRRAHHRPLPRVVVSEVEGDASVIGAAMLPLKALYFT